MSLCDKCANMDCNHEVEPGEIVVQCGAFKSPLTNADRIRAMSDEKLAYFLAYSWATSARAWQKDYGETLRWLQLPKEEADEKTDI